MPRPTHRDRWFRLPGVREWRRKVFEKYHAGTLTYIQAKYPELQSPAKPIDRAIVQRVGRSGVQLTLGEEVRGAVLRSRRLKRERSRIELARGLDSLLGQMSFEEVSVRQLTERKITSRAALYDAFPSGVWGLYSYWARLQLDELVHITKQDLGLAMESGSNTREALATWSASCSKFVMQKPYGRLAIFDFVLVGSDRIGASRIRELRDFRGSPEGREKRKRAVDDFASLAADLQRAGARLITALEPLFRRHTPGRVQPAGDLALPEEDIWSQALHFWQSITVGVVSVGLLEAEEQRESYRRRILRLWGFGLK